MLHVALAAGGLWLLSQLKQEGTPYRVRTKPDALAVEQFREIDDEEEPPRPVAKPRPVARPASKPIPVPQPRAPVRKEKEPESESESEEEEPEPDEDSDGELLDPPAEADEPEPAVEEEVLDPPAEMTQEPSEPAKSE